MVEGSLAGPALPSDAEAVIAGCGADVTPDKDGHFSLETSQVPCFVTLILFNRQGLVYVGAGTQIAHASHDAAIAVSVTTPELREINYTPLPEAVDNIRAGVDYLMDFCNEAENPTVYQACVDNIALRWGDLADNLEAMQSMLAVLGVQLDTGQQ